MSPGKSGLEDPSLPSSLVGWSSVFGGEHKDWGQDFSILEGPAEPFEGCRHGFSGS